MTKINIQRSSEYINRIRSYRIYIDGKKVGTIENGEIKEFEVEEGNHIIEARIDWCGSPKVAVEIKNDEIKKLKVSGFYLSKWIFPIFFFLFLFHAAMEVIFNFDYVIYILYTTFLIFVYYLTIGSKKYLSLDLEN